MEKLLARLARDSTHFENSPRAVAIVEFTKQALSLASLASTSLFLSDRAFLRQHLHLSTNRDPLSLPFNGDIVPVPGIVQVFQLIAEEVLGHLRF